MKFRTINRPKNRTSKKVLPQRKKANTLISPAGMGGIIGGEGYDFQTRYIVCHIPKWLGDPSFSDLAHEMTGDVDIRFGNTQTPRREHIQVKDHEVKKAEFKGVVNVFMKWEMGMPGTYSHFTLACTLVDKNVHPLETGLKRFRGAAGFFEDKKSALRVTEQEVAQRVGRVGLSAHKRFILGKLGFETGLSDFHNNERSTGVFISEMQKLKRYENCTARELRPAYGALFTLVSSSRGKSLNRAQLERVIETSIRQSTRKSPSSIHLDVHNWTHEVYQPKADYELDWSGHFNRASRRIPTQNIWTNELLPELHQLSKTISKNTSNRLIQFRGRCCLSTVLATGAAFPENGGWVFEVAQPQMPTSWRSDAAAITMYPMKSTETTIYSQGDSIALVVNVTGKATTEVQDFIVKNKLPVKALICIEPSESAGSRSITSDSEAVSLAVAVRDYLKEALTRQRVQVTHLFYYGPQGLAIFLGQKLTSLGQIQLYEYQNPGYMPTCLLKT